MTKDPTDERFHVEHRAQEERLITLGTMCALVAHEFNNILTPVLSYAEMALQRDDDPAFQRKALEKALAGTTQAAEIAAAILGYSRTGGDEEPAESDVEEIFGLALRCMARPLSNDGIELESSFEPDLRAAIQPVALQHVLLNLVLNACRAMTPGGAWASDRAHSDGAPRVGGRRRLCVTASTVSDPGVLSEGEVASRSCSTWNIGSRDAWGVITIEDSGGGIPAGSLASIFEPFVTGSQGSGLGLATCARLVHAHGGWLTCASVEGQGTRMRVVLPVCDTGMGVGRRAA